MRWILLLITLLTFATQSQAAETEVKTKMGKKSSRKSATRDLLKKSYYDVDAQYIVWQEKIDATGTGITGTGRFQFSGFQLGGRTNKPFASSVRWVRQYSAHALFGTVKGNGESGSFADEFKNQTWFAATGSAALLYRTSAASELGISLPISARMINWTFADGATIELERETSFSAGLGLQFVQRFNMRSSLIASVTHQFLWEATQWSVGYQYSLR